MQMYQHQSTIQTIEKKYQNWYRVVIFPLKQNALKYWVSWLIFNTDNKIDVQTVATTPSYPWIVSNLQKKEKLPNHMMVCRPVELAR